MPADRLPQKGESLAFRSPFNRRVQFLAGVEVGEISMEDGRTVNETFKPVWSG